MQYQLQTLEALVCTELKPANLIKRTNKAATIAKLKDAIAAEVIRIQNAIVEELMNCSNEKQAACYFQNHHQQLIRVTDVLYRYLQKKVEGSIWSLAALKGFATNYAELLQSMEELLIELEQRFTAYYNRTDHKITEYRRQRAAQDVAWLAKEVDAVLMTAGIDQELTSLVKQPLKDVVGNDVITTQHDLDYLKVYASELESLLTRNEFSEQVFITFLMEMNFNEPAFAFYYIRRIRDDEKDRPPTLLLEYYYEQLKIVNQSHKRHGLLYDHTLPSFHDQLGTWLAEEIYFMEKKHFLERTLAPAHTESLDPSQKVETKLSVAHLSLGVKLLLDTGIIKNKNASEVMRLVSKNFRTTKSLQISEDSLRNKAYNIDRAVAAGMKDVLIGLMNEVRKY